MTTNLNIRTDKNIKDQAEEIFNQLGLNMTTAINIFLRTAVRENGIPFELKLDTPNNNTKADVMNLIDKFNRNNTGNIFLKFNPDARTMDKKLII